MATFGPDNHTDPNQIQCFWVSHKYYGWTEKYIHAEDDGVRELEAVTIYKVGPEESNAAKYWRDGTNYCQEFIIFDVLHSIFLESVYNKKSDN